MARFNPAEVAEAARRLRKAKPLTAGVLVGEDNDILLVTAYSLAVAEGPVEGYVEKGQSVDDGCFSSLDLPDEDVRLKFIALVRRDPECKP